MASDWKTVSIDSIKDPEKGAIAIGPFGSRMKSDCYVDSGIPVIRGTNITGGHSFSGNFVYISHEKAASLGSCNVYEDDLVFPHRGSIGEVGIVPKGEHYVISSSLMKLTSDKTKVDPKFLYYFFKSRLGRYELLKNASQVGTPGIGQPLSSLKVCELKRPPLHEQKTIAQVLGALDDKIELNRQMNQTLEGMAQALFKSWFVDFDPVIDNALAAGNPIPEALKSKAAQRAEQLKAATQSGAPPVENRELFPSEFAFTEELGWIPKGWQIKTAEQIANISIGKTPPRKEQQWFSESQINNVTWISIRDMGESGIFKSQSSEYLTQEAMEKFNVKLIPKDSVILSFKLTIGRVSIADLPLATNEAIAHFVNPKFNLSKEYIYSYLKNFDFERLGSTSSIAFAVNSKIIKAMPFIVPDPDVLSHFKNLVGSYFNKISLLEQQTCNLEKLRDTLLPKLLSGELRIAEAAALVEGV